MKAVETESLTKTYKNGVQALKGLTMSVEQGEIFSLLGPNGAGKSTLINILTTYLKPSGGKAFMLGRDIYKEGQEIRKEIACVAQKTSIDSCLSLKENMMFQGRLYRIPKDEIIKTMDNLIESFDLKSYVKYPVQSYSGGVKRRVDIAMNLMSKPKILFLDEPTTGMDIQSRRAMWNMVKKIRSDFGTTIFLTTHYLEEADSLSDTICIMKGGKEIVQGSPDNLKGYLRQNMISVSFENNEEALKAYKTIKEYFGEDWIQLRKDKIIVDTDLENQRKEMNTIGRFLMDKDIEFSGIEIAKPSLDDVFIKLIGNK